MKSYLPDPRGQKTKEDAPASSTKLTHRDRQPETAGQSGKLPTVSQPVEKQAEDQSKGRWTAEQLKIFKRGEQDLREMREERGLPPIYYSIFDKPKSKQRDCQSEKDIAASTPSRPKLPSHHIPVVKKKNPLH
jgi:hypothetical protein